MAMALDGLVVLDLTSFLSGPYCTMLLGDMGADVIKVERPGNGDEARRMPPFEDGRSVPFVLWNRNKRSIVLDLKAPDDLAVLRRLALRADILVENFRPGTLDRVGLSFEALHPANPRLIYASISGFGQTGPYAPRGGVDQIAQGMGGLMSITGAPEGGPMRVGIPINDLTAGNLLALGIMTKLYDRERTGQGGWVHTSLLESQVFMLDFQASRYLMDAEVAGQAGNDHPVNIPMGVFPTADRPINIAASSAKLWESFCRAAGRPEWLQVEAWKTPRGRSADRVAVNAAVADVTRLHPSDWWIDTLEAAGIPCGPINDIAQVFADPQVRHLEMAMPMRHRTRGDIQIVASPLNIEGVETGVYRDVPTLGEHGAEILAEAGLSQPEIEALRAHGVLGA